MPQKMKAAVYYGAGDIRIEQVPVPVPDEGEALIRVLRSGICGTDASEWMSGPKVFPVVHAHPHSGHVGPMIPGHEFVGEVREFRGPAAFGIGDVVVSGAGIWCGRCDRCLEGRTNLCASYRTLGLNMNGGMAEYVVCPVKALRAVPSGMNIDAAGLAQPLAVGIHAARRSGAGRGDRVVVIGAGAIGSFVLAGLKHLRDLDVTVVDFPGRKLERAARLGADRTIEAGERLTDTVVAILGGKPDVVIEASGAPGQLAVALKLVRDGGRVLAVGIPKGHPELDVHSMVFREVTLETTLAHICDEDLDASLRILSQGVLAAELAETPRPLEDLGVALDQLASGRVEGKILITPSFG
ncbi:(R,R)-butanediol dehydrogenase / meso-butanediol dehydrogenase / diacetyl reductase [Arthrobacter sp. cf158]|nr:(R,R)-butanediol dehydrogenase / meso-butanediol dehydrogenase / diacetyl reductase [Arthrobacter sp. cf158]